MMQPKQSQGTGTAPQRIASLAGLYLLFSSNARIARTSKHSGSIKCLQFNPHKPELLASAGAKGELYITDLNNPENLTRVGASAARADDFDSIDWNKKVPHILVTGSTGGFVTVWDVKAKKESLTLNNYGRKPVSAVAWNPDVPTRLAAAVPSDQDPLILLWDLRNSSQPERILKGHDQGVLSLSWCTLDSDLLLSSGKDNRNICWNPHTGQILGEFPIVLNAAFQTRFCPHQPNLLATASFDNKIKIETIQNANAKAASDGAGDVQQSMDANDFFATAQTQPQVSSFNLSTPPKWMKRPVGVSFGFGGRIVTFNNPVGQKSSVKIDTFVSDSGVESSIGEFQTAMKSNDVSKMCDSRIENATDNDGKEYWKAIKALLSDSPRKQLLAHLGFDANAADQTDRPVNGTNTENADDEISWGSKDGETKASRLSAFFSSDSTNFLTDLASSKGVKTNNLFHIFTGDESEADKQITRSLMLGSFEQALDLCLREKRMSDAFMIAICGGQKCIDKAQAAYFSQQSSSPNYVRLLASVVGKNLWDVVHNANIQNWKETMAILCTYADEEEFPDLCEALGDRLEEAGSNRKDASFCFLAGSKLEKVVPIWAQEMHETETARTGEPGDESAFSIHVQALQSFIEKVSIFRRAAQYEDKGDQQEDSAYKLEILYNKYAEYADVVAAHGHLALAEEYIGLLPNKYPAADAAKSRIQQALKKPVVGARTSSKTAQTPAAPSFTPATQAPPVPTAPTTRGPTPNTYMPHNNYTAPVAPSSPSSYNPSQGGNAFLQTAPYAPAGAYQPSGQQYAPGPQPGGSHAGPPSSIPPPPRAGGPSVNGGGGTTWNDLPEGLSTKPRSGRGTPAPQAVPSPFPNQSNPYAPSGPTSPPNQQPPLSQQRPGGALPPPPKAGEVPPQISSPSTASSPQTLQPPGRPSSSAANTYAPPPSAAQGAPQTGIPQRNASSYNLPPTTTPSSSRYAPAPAAQSGPPSGPPQTGGPPITRPSGGQNPYAAPPPSQNQYAPQQAPPPTGGQGPPPSGPLRMGPPPRQGAGAPPMGGPPRPTSATSPSPAPTAAKHPPGDRAHIPPDAQPIYNILHPEMQRIKGRAPANFKPQVEDTEKRLNLLFDGLNNETIPGGAVAQLKEIANCMQARDFEKAQSILTELLKEMEGSGLWLVSISLGHT